MTKNEYMQRIIKLMMQTNDVSLLDLILKILEKSR